MSLVIRKKIHSVNCLALLLLLMLSVLIVSVQAQAESAAKGLFDDKAKLVYQIRVIDIASGDKYSIGSGFLISDSGRLASNFHVVSSYVHEPDKYRLEYIAADGSVGELELLAVDAVRDLAIVQADQKSEQYLKLAEGELFKGERIYSMGNPHDLGMTIVEGNYNGLVEKSRYQKILFSGSLNAGMSGGPALNAAGEVIGVNVSKGGEQLSFLVPVQYLVDLLASVEGVEASPDFRVLINQALLEDQDEFYTSVLEAPLTEKPMGQLLAPGELHESLKCWGHTVDEEDIKYEAVHQHCKSEDEIFISNTLHVGNFTYDVELLNSSELNRFQFYNLLEERFSHRSFTNTYDKEDVTHYDCYDQLVTLSSGLWKVSTCLRAYKDYAGLYDSSMIMVSMDYPHRAAIVKVAASGISSENTEAVFQRIMGAVSWKE